MGKLLINWETNPAIPPTIDQKERLNNVKGLIGLVKKDLGEGKFEDWGAFVGGRGGYAIVEGTIEDVAMVMSKYIPWVQFEVVPTMSANEVDVLYDKLLKQ